MNFRGRYLIALEYQDLNTKIIKKIVRISTKKRVIKSLKRYADDEVNH